MIELHLARRTRLSPAQPAHPLAAPAPLVVVVALLGAAGCPKREPPPVSCDAPADECVAWTVDEDPLPGFGFGDGFERALWNDPWVLPLAPGEGGGYRMWLTAGNPFESPIRVSVFTATSADGLSWTRDDSPLLEPGPSGAWDDARVETPTVVRTPDGTFHLYYSGCAGACGGGIYAIGHATSPDGLTWTKDPANPVITTQDDPGQWGFYTAAEPAAIYRPAEDQIFLYYVAARGESVDGSGTFGVLLAKSTDGSRFVHHEEGGARAAVWSLTPSHPDTEYRGYSTPAAFVDGDQRVHLVYDHVAGPKDFFQVGLGYARSDDGVHFTEVTPNIVCLDKSVPWRSDEVRAPSIVVEQGRVRLWYAGSSRFESLETFETGIGYAEAAATCE